jgi:haloalkane dehalogenase
VQAYRTPDERFDGLAGWPYGPHYVVQDGLRMHYVDEGAGPPFLLLHGEPTWAFLYRRMIPPLAEGGRVVAPDLFGFGRSDKPLRQADYSYDAHSNAVATLVAELDLRDLTLVVHDWGGPIGMRLAVEQPDRVARLVILNTGSGAGRAPSPEWLRFRELVRRVGVDFTASRLVAASCVRELDAAARAGYDAPFPTAESKAGPLAFPELVPTELDHPSAPAMLRVHEAMSRWEKPALVLFSDSDRVFSPAHAERLAHHIPPARCPPRSSRERGTFCRRTRATRSPPGSSASPRAERYVSIRGRNVPSPRSGGAPMMNNRSSSSCRFDSCNAVPGCTISTLPRWSSCFSGSSPSPMWMVRVPSSTTNTSSWIGSMWRRPTEPGG